jgi:glucan phosphoethanolaminetransferase (alkaline phosphatase superfamily)
MRTTVIPAQITTVEDKIAGSLNMTQILILMFPVLWTALVYLLFYPAMKLTLYKLPLILLVTLICLILVIRIKDKIVAEWLGVLLKFRLRPKYYLFNKNDLTNRTVDIPDLPIESVTAKKTVKELVKAKSSEIKLSDLIKLENFISSGKVVRYQFNKKTI